MQSPFSQAWNRADMSGPHTLFPLRSRSKHNFVTALSLSSVLLDVPHDLCQNLKSISISRVSETTKHENILQSYRGPEPGATCSLKRWHLRRRDDIACARPAHPCGGRRRQIYHTIAVDES